MKRNMVIGIPRALLYYNYGNMWLNFFDELGINYIISPKTNKKILKRGIKLTNDEACLSLKIYMGHVDFLKDRCDILFIPRIGSLKANEVVCTNFNAIYDLTRNLFPELNILEYDIDFHKNKTEYKEFVKIGKLFKKGYYETTKAYVKAKNKEKDLYKQSIEHEKAIINSNKRKVLIVGHTYNMFDEFIGSEIKQILTDFDINVLYANGNFENKMLYKKIMPSMYFSYNKKIVNSLLHNLRNVDGIILLSTFPCGTDALINEMIIRKIKNKPIINVIFDELAGTAGLETRLESFIDIIKREV